MKEFNHGGLIKAWTDGVPVENAAWDQIGRVAERYKDQLAQRQFEGE